MSFQPVVPLSGYAGWTFLKRTQASQQATLQKSAVHQRDDAYFRENIGKITSAEQLVNDRRLLNVALTAFGLQNDLNSKAYVRKILAEGTTDERSMANRMADKTYRNLAEAFGFGPGETRKTTQKGFADKILAQYHTRSFETAIGNQNESLRLAMNAERELTLLANSKSSEDTKWFTIMGNKPLREVMQTAFGLPSGFASLDIDQQLGVFKSKSRAMFGSSDLSQLQKPENLQKVLRNYLVRDEISQGSSRISSASIALQLLSF